MCLFSLVFMFTGKGQCFKGIKQSIFLKNMPALTYLSGLIMKAEFVSLRKT